MEQVGVKAAMSNNIKKLAEKHPLVFANMSESSHSDLPDGWMTLVDELCSKLTPLLVESYANYPLNKEDYMIGITLDQIKEKFGGLRFYCSFLTEDSDLWGKATDIINEYENRSYSVCQVTGKPGTQCSVGRQVITLCEEERIRMNGITMKEAPFRF